MEVRGNIATPLEKKQAKSGTEFYVFRLAENIGKDEKKTTTWYDVIAFIDELSADLLGKGMFVRVYGKLEVQAFTRKDGSPGAAPKIVAFKVDPIAFEKKPEA